MSAIAMEPKTGFVLSITRTFDAPRELVWKAWTDPEMLKQWSGPRGFRATEYETPSEAGGAWRMAMEGDVPGTKQRAKLTQKGVVKDLRPPELLVYTFAWEDRACVGLPESAHQESVITVRLEEKDGKTVMHFTQAPFATEGERDGHNGGWNSAFDKFAEFMMAEQPHRKPAEDELPTELHLRRIFAASRQDVFDAWTKPEILAKWWGSACFTNPVCEMDARQGGAIRIHMQGPDGTVHPMIGRVIEVWPPYRFHFTASPLNAQGERVFDMWTSVFLAEADQGTEVFLDLHVMRSTPEAAMYLRGMDAGWRESLDRLRELVARSDA